MLAAIIVWRWKKSFPFESIDGNRCLDSFFDSKFEQINRWGSFFLWSKFLFCFVWSRDYQQENWIKKIWFSFFESPGDFGWLLVNKVLNHVSIWIFFCLEIWTKKKILNYRFFPAFWPLNWIIMLMCSYVLCFFLSFFLFSISRILTKSNWFLINN